ncbi:MAG: WecB/TagA/CpsF family glycosyltransferase [Luteitalea sp.]|nr:WecB/TagA/CpsF family glycosyltransferase [Luteitalea sp.]
MPSDFSAAPGIARFDVLGLPVSAIDLTQAVQTIDTWIRERTPHYVCITGVHGVMESRRDESLRRIHARAGMVTPDGMPLVWLGHVAGHGHVRRVYGPDLMLACLRRSLQTRTRHFFFGGGPGVAEQLAARLSAQLPGLLVAGTYCPPFRPLTPEEDERVIEEIDGSDADVVWVGLSTPKQERWMADHVSRLRAPVLVGVGAAFDFHAGLKPQAPGWMQRNGLEWLFRLATEPRRLWRRYLINNPAFIWHVTRAWMRGNLVRQVPPSVERSM